MTSIYIIDGLKGVVFFMILTCCHNCDNFVLDFIAVIISGLTLIVAIVGSIFAYRQWKKNVSYKRSEFVSPLIEKIRSDERITTILRFIDRDEKFEYDGKFKIKGKRLKNIYGKSDFQFGKDIDYTLATLSYACYLFKEKVLSDKDMIFFDYNIAICFDNIHIVNYLYSIYHFSHSMRKSEGMINTAHLPLIEYAIEKKMIDISFKQYIKEHQKGYKCYLDKEIDANRKKREGKK